MPSKKAHKSRNFERDPLTKTVNTKVGGARKSDAQTPGQYGRDPKRRTGPRRRAIRPSSRSSGGVVGRAGPNPNPARSNLQLNNMQKAVVSIVSALVAGAAVFYGADAVKLPQPFHTPSANNGPRVIPRPSSADLKLPSGFHAEVWAEGFDTPRFMLEGPSREILLSDSAEGGAGSVYVLQNNGKTRKKLISGLDRPYGLALWKDYLYVGEPTSIKRYKYDSKNLTASQGQEIIPLTNFPRGHWTRSLLFDRQGTKLYVGVGSGSLEPELD